jgi:hypothetical protein
MLFSRSLDSQFSADWIAPVLSFVSALSWRYAFIVGDRNITAIGSERGFHVVREGNVSWARSKICVNPD